MKMLTMGRGSYGWMVVVLLGTGCSESPVNPPVEPPDEPPDPVVVPAIAIVSGNFQSGLAGEFLSEPFVVKVTDESGRPHSRSDVTWLVETGSGTFPEFDCRSVTSMTTRPRPDGLTEAWFSPSAAEAATVSATVEVPEAPNRFVTFEVDVTGQLIYFSPGGVDWWSGCNNPAEGFAPSFATVPVGSTVKWENSTDARTIRIASSSIPTGAAEFESGPLYTGDHFVIVPDVVGIWDYVDTVSGKSGRLVVVSATSPEQPTAPAALELVAGDAQFGKTGEELEQPFVVKVIDASGHAVGGVEVEWTITSGDGRLRGTAIDDVSGSVTLLTNVGGRSFMSFVPFTVGPVTVAASVSGADGPIWGSPVVFTTYVTTLVITVEYDWWNDEVGFFGPDGSSDAEIPVGTTVEWVNRTPAARITSTMTPPGGSAFDSGQLQEGERFQFVPQVPGTWEFVDAVGGSKGTLTAFEPT